MPIYYDNNYPVFLLDKFELSGFVPQPDGVLTLAKLGDIDKIMTQLDESYTVFQKEDKRTCIVDTGV